MNPQSRRHSNSAAQFQQHLGSVTPGHVTECGRNRPARMACTLPQRQHCGVPRGAQQLLRLLELHATITAWQEGGVGRTASELKALVRLVRAAPPNIVLTGRRSVLNAACIAGDAEAIIGLLHSGWDPSLVDKDDGMNAYHLVALGMGENETLQSRILSALLDWGIACERSLAQAAVSRSNQPKAGVEALAHGAIAAPETCHTIRPEPGNARVSAVWHAATEAALDQGCPGARHTIVLRPAAAGAAMGARSDGATALHLAALTGNFAATRDLLQLEPGLLRMSARARPAAGGDVVTTTLETCKLIDSVWSRPSTPIKQLYRSRPLHWSSLGGSLEITALLANAASPSQLNSLDELGCSPLMLAASSDTADALQALLEEPAVDVCQRFGRPVERTIRSQPWQRRWTALHALAYIGLEASAGCVVRFVRSSRGEERLLSSRRRLVAALCARDTTGQTPSMLARTRGNPRVAEKLDNALQLLQQPVDTAWSELQTSFAVLVTHNLQDHERAPEVDASSTTPHDVPPAPSPSVASDAGSPARSHRAPLVPPSAEGQAFHDVPAVAFRDARRGSLASLPASESSSSDTLTSPVPLEGGGAVAPETR